jgi:uncharacterized membrane protein YfcA
MLTEAHTRLDIRLMLLGFAVAFFSAGIGGGTILVSVFISVFHFDFKGAAALARQAVSPIDDIRASAQYRRRVSGKLVLHLK